MGKAISIIVGLVGYNTAVKIWMIIKMLKLRVDNMNETEINNLVDNILNDPKYRKYMR